MLESLREFTQSMPEALQWVGVMLISAIPFVESIIGSALGVVAGVPVVVAIAAAVVGNALSMVLVVQIAHLTRSRVRRDSSQDPKELSPRRQRILRLSERFGVPGVSLLGQWVLPSQITAPLLVSVGGLARLGDPVAGRGDHAVGHRLRHAGASGLHGGGLSGGLGDTPMSAENAGRNQSV